MCSYLHFLNFASDLNLLDWSSTNLLAVCLGPRLYLWNAANGEIHQLLEMDSEADYVSSVAWLPDGSHIAVGTSTMEVQVLQFCVECHFVTVIILYFNYYCENFSVYLWFSKQVNYLVHHSVVTTKL